MSSGERMNDVGVKWARHESQRIKVGIWIKERKKQEITNY